MSLFTMTQNPKCEWLSFVKRSRVDLSRWEWDGASLPLIFGSLVAHLLPPFTFVASFHRGNTKKVPNVFLLRGNRRRSRYIRKEKKTIVTDIQRWAKMTREIQFGWGTLIWFKISWFLMSLFFVLEIHDKEDHPLFWQVVPIYDHPATCRQQK